jgi:hypothetical protein
MTFFWRVLGCGWREVLRVRRVAANILNKQSRIADKGWCSSLGVGRGATTPHWKNLTCYEMFQSASSMEQHPKGIFSFTPVMFYEIN